MKAAVIAVLIAAGFTGGYGYGRWYGKKAPMGAAVSAEQKKPDRKILYWVDPMHPAYKSDKPICRNGPGPHGSGPQADFYGRDHRHDVRRRP